MARSRNIKPGFFKNDILAEIEPLGRLLFAGLWTIADREGRLEDRPKRIKVEILPYDDCDVDHLLQVLHNKEFITRYEVGGERYIQINNFKKHQNPHKNEAPSTIPAPPKEHSTSTVQVPERYTTNPADSLNSDYFNPITDSFIDPTTATTPPAENLFHRFEQEFGRPLSPIEIEHIQAWEKEHPPELVVEALKRAVTQGKHNFRYIETILTDWKKNNIRTLLEVKRQDQEFERKKKGGVIRGPTNRSTGNARGDPGQVRSPGAGQTVQFDRSKFEFPG